MKNIFTRRFLGIPMAVIAVILVAAVALAAWGVTNLTSTGTITVTAVPQEFTYTTDGTVMEFGNPIVPGGGAISINSAPIVVTNTGNMPISGFNLSNITGLPASITGASVHTGLSTNPFPLDPGEPCTIYVKLVGTAPTTTPGNPTSIPLGGIKADLTPN